MMNSICYNTRSKKNCILQSLSFGTIKRKTVSATHLFNYMKNDAIVDWLKIKDKKNTTHTNHCSSITNIKKTQDFETFIKHRGNEFESHVVRYIDRHFHNVKFVSDRISSNSLSQTKQLMKKGVPIIHSAPLKNHYNSTQGIADLLIRSDYINSIFEMDVLSKDEIHRHSTHLKKDYYYIVVDIKFSTLPLCSEGIHLLNCSNYTA